MRVPERATAGTSNGTSLTACPVVIANSEVKLGADLADAGIPGPCHHTHLSVEIAVRVVELRMVEQVEEIGADFESF